MKKAILAIMVLVGCFGLVNGASAKIIDNPIIAENPEELNKGLSTIFIYEPDVFKKAKNLLIM